MYKCTWKGHVGFHESIESKHKIDFKNYMKTLNESIVRQINLQYGLFKWRKLIFNWLFKCFKAPTPNKYVNYIIQELKNRTCPILPCRQNGFSYSMPENLYIHQWRWVEVCFAHSNCFSSPTHTTLVRELAHHFVELIGVTNSFMLSCTISQTLNGTYKVVSRTFRGQGVPDPYHINALCKNKYRSLHKLNG